MLSIALSLLVTSHAQEAFEGAGPTVGVGDPSPGETVDEVDEDGVVGGRQVSDGKWDDAVGIDFFGQFVGCTGTLIGPRVVLTAGHCVQGVQIPDVIVGSKDWTREGGELLDVDEVFEYPDSTSSYDVAIITLRQRSTIEPRPIALDCIVKDYLQDGMPAKMVGFGATTEAGSDFNTKLNQANTTIVDRNCDESAIDGISMGCENTVSPGGEVAGFDSDSHVCYGDSGGPLYLQTDRGDYVAGVASRLWIGSPFNAPCSSGSIWVRPDAVIDWIEEVVGQKTLAYPTCNEPASLVSRGLVTPRDHAVAYPLVAVDPDGDPTQITWGVATPPDNGTATVDSDGVVRYVPDEGFVGEDAFTLSLTDADNPRWPRTGQGTTTEHIISVVVIEPTGLACSATPARVAWGWMAAPLLLALGRRRRGAV